MGRGGIALWTTGGTSHVTLIRKTAQIRLSPGFENGSSTSEPTELKGVTFLSGRSADGVGTVADGHVAAVVIRKPSPAKVAHALDDGKESEPLGGERILNARRHFSKACAPHHGSVLEPLEALRQSLGADPRQGTFQLAESLAAVCKIAHDQGCPLVSDDLGGTRHWTTKMSCVKSRHGETFWRGVMALSSGYFPNDSIGEVRRQSDSAKAPRRQLPVASTLVMSRKGFTMETSRLET